MNPATGEAPELAIVLPVYSLLYNMNLLNPGLIGVTVLGSIGYVAVGTLLAAFPGKFRRKPTDPVSAPITLDEPVADPDAVPADV